MLLSLKGKQNKMKHRKRTEFLFFCTFILFFSSLSTSCIWWERKKEVSRTESCESGNAPFIVSQITKSSNDEAITVAHGEDGLVQTFTLNLKACIRDLIRQDTPIQNSSFAIDYYNSVDNKVKGKAERAMAVSDSQGCIQWQEKYKYKYTVKPVWIGLERVIKKESGAYAGAETIPMAINPWLSPKDKEDGLPSILDTRCEYSKGHHIFDKKKNYDPNGLNYLKKTRTKERPFLWAPRVSLQIHESTLDNGEGKHLSLPTRGEETEKEIRTLLGRYQKTCRGVNSDNNLCYKRQLEMVLYIPLQLRTLDMSSSSEEDLHGGAYDVETRLVISPKAEKKNYLLHEKACIHKSIQLENTYKRLSLRCHLDLSYFSQNALYRLVLKITPSSEKLPFKKFEGVYTINLNFENVRKDFNIDTAYDGYYQKVLNTEEELKIIESLDIQNMYELSEDSKKSAPDDSQSQQKIIMNEGPIKGVDFYSLHLDGYGEYKLSHIQNNASVCSEKENVVQRTVVFVGKICLKDVLGSRKLNNTPFRVFLEKPKEDIIKEIYFNENQHFYTDGRDCISIPVELKHNIYNRQKYFQVDIHVLSESLNLYGKVRLALSPWQRAFQSFQDAQNLNEKQIRFDTQGIPKPQLIINQFRSINLFPSYGLDKLLKIHLLHRIYLLFQPFIRRPDNLSLGLDFRSRELLRDGYYLVRVLILRNPQETGDSGLLNRVATNTEHNKARQNKTTEGRIPLKDAKYITHTDSVVFAKANFINFYMPIYLSTKQLYYVASRNFIVIEIYPADPLKFQYNNNCEIDMEKTEWKPFFNHELENVPYAGVINIQNWMNWNLLQPAEINTDQTISQSEIGKKYKHFHFSTSGEQIIESYPQEERKSLQTGCVNNINNKVKIESIQKDLLEYECGSSSSSKCHSLASGSFRNADPEEEEIENCSKDPQSTELSPALERYKNREELRMEIDVLESFAEENGLKTVHLSSSEGDRFVRHINESFSSLRESGIKKLIESNRSSRFVILRDNIKRILRQLPKEDAGNLRKKMNAVCFPFFKRLRIHKSSDEIKCELRFLMSYFENMKDLNEGKDPLSSLLRLILDKKLVDEESMRGIETAMNMCKNQSNKLACHQHIRDYVIKAIAYSFQNNLLEKHLLGEKVFSLLSVEEKEDFLNSLSKCFSVTLSFSFRTLGYERCYFRILKEKYYNRNVETEVETSKPQLLDIANETQKSEFIKSLLNNVSDLLLSFTVQDPLSKKSIMNLVKERVKPTNSQDLEVLSFAKSLCVFWFDFFIKNYLEKKQIIGAYTKYIQKFDYHQILDADDIPYNEKISFLSNFLKYLESQDESKKLSGCYYEYAQCLTADYCLDRNINQNKSCNAVEGFQDKSCLNILKEECSKQPSLSLCREECLLNPDGENCREKNLCNKKVVDFCEVNGDQFLCERYNNRCFSSGYLNCIGQEDNSSLFSVDNVINYKINENPFFGIEFPPLATCVRNPYEFFKFENKMMVHEISKENPKYKWGFLQNFVISENHSIGSYMNWTAQRGRSISVSSKAGVDFTGGQLMRRVSSFFKIGADASVSQSKSSNESNSSRQAIDIRVGGSAMLSVANATITIGIAKFQKCLVIKPRPNAFTASLEGGEAEVYKGVWSKSEEHKDFKKIFISRPGLILCNPIETREEGDSEKITESYYYISQLMDASSSEFLNLYDLANRPFVLTLRGRGEFIKYYYLMRKIMSGDGGAIDENTEMGEFPGNMFIKYPFPVEESRGLSLTIREFNETGFHPGVYDYPDNSDELLESSWYAETNAREIIMDPLTKYNIFSIPKTPQHTVPVQQ